MPGQGVLRVSANGGAPEVVAPAGLDGDERVQAFVRPQLLPGDEWLLYSEFPSGKVMVRSLATGDKHVLVEDGGGDAVYLPTGHLAYVLEDTLFAVPFDADRLTVTGGPVSLVEGIIQGGNGLAQFFFAHDGTLVYQHGVAAEQRTLVWVDRDGREEPIGMPPRPYQVPSLSPDGRRVVVDSSGGDAELYVFDLETGVEEQFTFHPVNDWYPLWTPDGSSIVFRSDRDPSGTSLYVRSADGSGSAELLGTFPFAVGPSSWADNGETLVFGGTDILTLSMDAHGEFENLLETPFAEAIFKVSPNRHWIAYRSNEGGSSQIWVRPFPDLAGGGQ